MIVKRTLIPGITLLAALTLSACAGGGNAVDRGSGSSHSAAGSAAGTSSSQTQSAKPEAPEAATWGDTVTFPNGVKVTVSRPTAVAAGQFAYGAVEGKIVTFDVSVTNGTTKALNGALMSFPNVSYGVDGQKAQHATDVAAKIGGSYLSTIPIGDTQTVKVGYGIPSAGYGAITVEVTGPTFGDEPAIFKGAVTAG